MRATINTTAHRGNGGRRLENDGGRGLFPYPQYTRKISFVQSLKRKAARPMMRAGLALTGAGERLGSWGQLTAARLALGLAIAGDRLAAAALRWECAA